MKRNNSVSWIDSPSKADDQKKRRTISLNNTINTFKDSEISKLLNHAPCTKVEDILNIKLENIDTSEVDISDLSSSLDINDEFFSDIFVPFSFIIKNIEKEDDCIKLRSDNCVCICKDEWMEIDFYVNMKVTIFDCTCCSKPEKCHSAQKIIVVDDFNNFLIIEDKILSVTSICNALKCIYIPILKEKIMDLSFEYSHPSLSIGIIVHNVIESCLKNQNYNLKYIIDTMKEEIKINIKILYSCNINEKNALIECTKYVKEILKLQKHMYKAFDTENKIISQKFNIKGIMDAVVFELDKKVPIEIKTGKYMDIQHRAQILLYNLMMKEKFTDSANYGYLFYVKSGHFLKIESKHRELKSILVLRNKLASLDFITRFNIENDQNIIQYPIIFKSACNCLEVENCKSIEKIIQTEGAKNIFFKEQWLAINEEEHAQHKNIFFKTFFKSQKDDILCVNYKNEEIYKLGEFVQINNSNKIKLCFGRIEKFDACSVIIKLSEKIHLHSFYEIYISNTKNELFFKIMRYSLLKIAVNDEFFYEKEGKNNNSLISTLSSTTEKYIDILSSNRNIESQVYKHGIPDIYKDEFLKLNEDQRSALYLSLNCERYRLIHGFPGTGKSTLISLLIKILVHNNKKVLLVCYTNLAIDNILKRVNINYYRALKEKKRFETVSEMKTYFDDLNLVVGTCYSFSDIIFINRKFDYCIIDEASQQHLLLSLIPISLAQKFVLVGDHFQLKPLTIKNESLKISLFEQLIKKSEICELKTQYRMGEEIMKISNEMFYRNKMIGTMKKSSIEFIDTLVHNNLEGIIGNLKLDDKTTILCYFNVQVSYVKEIVKQKCQVETVDRFQGSENDNIILIFDPIIDCEILSSKERLNVGITRAKKKLVMIGNKEKMLKIDIFRRLFEVIEKNMLMK